MKRFSMLVGVAVVAAAVYVAAAPGSQQATGPTARQFAALKKQVASLSKTVKTLKAGEKSTKTEADAAVSFIGGCLISANAGAVAVIQRGTTTQGYEFGTGTGDALTTALDVDPSATPSTFLQAVDPSCITAGGSLQGLARPGGGLVLRAEHTR